MKKIIVPIFCVAVASLTVAACVTTPPVANPGTDPVISVEMVGEVFSLNADDINAPQPLAKITVNHAPNVRIENWKIQVDFARRAPAAGQEPPAAQPPASPDAQPRQPFFELEGTGNPPNPWEWNGLSSRTPREGRPVARVQSAADYRLTVTVTDAFGNTGTGEGTFSTDVLVERDGDNYKIIVPSIAFPPDSAVLANVSEQDQRSNERVLRLIARALNRFRDYRVTVEGHSNPTTPPNTRERTAQEPALTRISTDRANAVMQWLITNGNVDRSRLTAVGRGAAQLAAPWDGDDDDKALNRRVEFILVK